MIDLRNTNEEDTWLLRQLGFGGGIPGCQRKILVNNSTFVNYISLSIVRNVTGCTAWSSECTTQLSVEVQLPLLRTGPL